METKKNKHERESDKAFAHAIEHLESAKDDISFAENIIRAAQERSKEKRRKDDKNI